MSENTHSEHQQTPSENSDLEKDQLTSKEALRKIAGEAVGLLVGATSALAGDSALMSDAEQDVASEKTEEFLDRIDGEG